MHEDPKEHQKVKLGTDKSFGVVFSVAFLLISIAGFWNNTNWYMHTILASLIFVILSFIKPVILRPLNFVWFKIGLLLHSIINPIIMSILFFIVITPFALIMRLFGKSPININYDNSAKSYWIDSEKTTTDFNKQF